MSALNYKKTSADRSGSLFAIVDKRISKNCETSLSRLGFEIIKLEADERLGEAVASHTDMLIFRYDDTLVCSRAYFEKNEELFKKIKTYLQDFKFILSDEDISKTYPHDAIFNALSIDNKIFIKTDTASKNVLDLARKRKLDIIKVKQGYPACTTLATKTGFAITSDGGMRNALEKNGISVLEIPESEKIKLPPYKNGFIGGAAGILDKTVYFLGNLHSHPHGKEIEAKLKEHGYDSVSLDTSSDSLFDLGGMILINTDKSGRSTRPKNPKSE